MKINVFDPVEFEPRGNCHVASAVIGAVGATAGGLISANASKSAAETQASAANNATQAQVNMFHEGENQVLPYVNFGKSLMPSLQNWIDPGSGSSPLATLLRLTTPGADMTSTLSQTPGFQFTKNIGTQAIDNALAARGLAGPGGPLARAGADYASGLASNTWQSVVNALLSTFGAGAAPLQNAVNTGAGAASSLLGGATQVGGQIGQNIVGAGNAQAAGTIGQANALSGITNNLGTYALLAKLGGGGAGGGIYATPADAGIGNGVGSGGFNFLDAAAEKGGKFKKGQRILVGEKGPELFIPHEDGTIIPNNVLASLVKDYKKTRRSARH